MRILIVAPSNSVHVQRWQAGLLSRGHQVQVFVREGQAGDGVHAPPRALRLCAPLRKAAILAGFQALYHTFRPEIIHQHWFEINNCVCMLPPAAKLVISVWGSDIVRPWSEEERQRAHRYAGRARAVLASSDFLAAQTREVLGCPVERIYWGIEPARFTPRSRTSARLLVIGFLKHLQPVYAPDLAIRAFARLHEVMPQSVLHMYGEGQLEEMRALGRQLGVEAAVRFYGQIPYARVAEALAEMDLLLMPSRAESLGIAALEAQAMGVPVIASRVGGIPEAVHDGVGGVLVPPDDLDALAGALLRLAGDAAARQQLGEQGMAFVRVHFDWAQTLDRVEEVYRRVQSAEKENRCTY